MYNIKNKKGFALIEILITALIVVLIILGTVGIYTMSITVWHEGNAQIALQRKGGIAMEKMVRGIDGRNGIREANDVTLPNTTTIQYTSGIDAQQRSFYLSDSEIMYDPDTSTIGDEFPIAENVRIAPPGLTFTVSDSIVTIDLGMEDQVKGKLISVDLSTQVKMRN